MKLLPNINTDTNFSKIYNVKLYYVPRMPYAIMISYIVSVNSSPFIKHAQLTAGTATSDMAQATILNNILFILYVVVTYSLLYYYAYNYT